MAQTATATKLRPLGDRVVIKPAAREETTRSGIVLPDTSTERPQRGAILAVGPGRVTDEGKKFAMEDNVGYAVLIAMNYWTEYMSEAEDMLVNKARTNLR